MGPESIHLSGSSPLLAILAATGTQDVAVNSASMLGATHTLSVLESAK